MVTSQGRRSVAALVGTIVATAIILWACFAYSRPAKSLTQDGVVWETLSNDGPRGCSLTKLSFPVPPGGHAERYLVMCYHGTVVLW